MSDVSPTPAVSIHAERKELRSHKVPRPDSLPSRLNRRIGQKGTREVQHRHAKRFADEIARFAKNGR